MTVNRYLDTTDRETFFQRLKNIVIEKEDGLRLSENEHHEPYFSATVLVEERGQNIEWRIRGAKEIARIEAITLEDLSNILHLDRKGNNITRESLITDIKSFSETSEFWGRKFSQSEAKIVLAMFETLQFNENAPLRSEMELQYDLILSQHKNETKNCRFFGLTLAQKGQQLSALGFPRSLLSVSLALQLILVLGFLAINLPVWIDQFFPGPLEYFSENLLLAWSVLMASAFFVGRMRVAREVPCLQVIRRSAIYFPHEEDGTIYFCVPTGSTVPLSVYLDYAGLVSGLHEIGIMSEQISERYYHYATQLKLEETSKALLKEHSGQVALKILQRSQETIQKVQVPQTQQRQFPSTWKIAWFLLGGIVVIVLLMIVFFMVSSFLTASIPATTPTGGL